jgi:hypothetical protein
MLEQHRLRIGDRVGLMPAEFHPQRLLSYLAGVYVYPSSAPLHVAHRRIGSRTQSRAELLAGSCLLRGERARREWTIAIPPLLVARAVALGARQPMNGTERQWSERTRKFALLVDVDAREDDITYDFHAFRTDELPVRA